MNRYYFNTQKGTIMKPIRATNRHTGFFWKDYTSIKDAAKDLKLRPDGISRALTNEYNYCGDYFFTPIKKEETNESIKN